MANEIIIDKNVMSSWMNGGEAPIRLCDEHEHDLQTKLQSRPDLFLTTFHLLTTIASNAIGTFNVVKQGCPVCALQEFDYIGELSKILITTPERKKHG